MSIYNIVFSPTGGTKKAADLFASSFCPESAGIDLADRSRDFSVFSFHSEDICIVSVPSYGGRVPAVAAVAEHSIMRRFAAGRPDVQDEKEIAAFAETTRSKIESGTLSACLDLPGNRPYREYRGVPMKPQAGKSCSKCGLCENECPVGAIAASDPSKTDTQSCISCMRCIAVCPQNARSVSKVLLAAGSMKLRKICREYKKNELFLP